ncbi:unnamed protein product [Camellia sinensis]
MSVNEQVNSVKEYAMKMESASVSWKRNFITDSLVPKKLKETPRHCKATLNLDSRFDMDMFGNLVDRW